ncbi:MAG: hypothetical protein QM530_04055 [Phycisphaerales bacterium]|nr:hypothetical protein [Phycisphaerales bacterium]
MPNNKTVDKLKKIFGKKARYRLAVIQKRLKRKWAFSNLVSFCKIHLFNCIQLIKFLENPEKDWIIDAEPIEQLSLLG